MPTARTQGLAPPAGLRADARLWGGQLRAAGVDLDLAPVADTVPTAIGARNDPIGYFRRDFGADPRAVGDHAVAFLQGLRDAHVASSAKHFPGLGRVLDNTDTTYGVTDPTTTRHDAFVRPFAATVRARVAMVMVSSAVYGRIDPGTPAVFSPTVVTGMLRHDLGFDGVVVSDSLSATAVSRVPVRERGVDFLRAGGDLVLVGIDSLVPQMWQGVRDLAADDDDFRALVDASALRVLRAKARQHLLGCP